MEQNDIATEEVKHFGVDDAAITQQPDLEEPQQVDVDQAATIKQNEPLSAYEEVKQVDVCESVLKQPT